MFQWGKIRITTHNWESESEETVTCLKPLSKLVLFGDWDPSTVPIPPWHQGSPSKALCSHPIPFTGDFHLPKISSSSREVVGRMTCQNNRGHSHVFWLPLGLQRVRAQGGSSSHHSRAPAERLRDGEPTVVLAPVVRRCLCQPCARGLGPRDAAPALRTLPHNLLTPWQTHSWRCPLRPHPPAVPHQGCPWTHITGHPCWAIKETCGRAAWCQGACQPPHKKAAPWAASGREWARSPEYQPFSWRDRSQQFSLRSPQTADAKNTLRSGPSFLLRVPIHHLQSHHQFFSCQWSGTQKHHIGDSSESCLALVYPHTPDWERSWRKAE